MTTKIKHRSTGQILEFEFVNADSSWIDVYEGGEKYAPNTKYGACLHTDFWEVLEPTIQDVLEGLEPGSVFHILRRENVHGPLCMVVDAHGSVAAGGGLVAHNAWGHVQGKIIVDHAAPKKEEF